MLFIISEHYLLREGYIQPFIELHTGAKLLPFGCQELYGQQPYDAIHLVLGHFWALKCRNMCSLFLLRYLGFRNAFLLKGFRREAYSFSCLFLGGRLLFVESRRFFRGGISLKIFPAC
jgi:hypothetical protein